MQSLVGENCGFCSEQYVKPRESVRRRRTGLSESFKGCLWLPGPGLGIKPASPALPGGFFTTEPPGKPDLLPS